MKMSLSLVLHVEGGKTLARRDILFVFFGIWFFFILGVISGFGVLGLIGVGLRERLFFLVFFCVITFICFIFYCLEL